MKTATIIHRETVKQYFKNGIEVTPSAEEKLMNELYPSMETKETTFNFPLEVVKYKNKKELTVKFWEVAEQFKNFIHPNDLVIE